ncbi:hypothetical protein [Metapseudomonas boanensis]|uniref:Uncharacterized protein n=1 Tax=Metapseudomonas boanensis TaxID=2822138 RepID=A0ABS5XH98_9GAMM|nr:hypothetical protein [Pseudomonas boanensis]MBT8767068.1 hypothetical protein [Pseudomonas boanensis]
MPYRKRLMVAAAMVAAGLMSNAHASDSATQAYCMEKWSGEAMRAYCQEEQREAAEAIASYGGPVRSRCESEWRADFHMVLFCIKEQQRLSQAAVADAARDATNSTTDLLHGSGL